MAPAGNSGRGYRQDHALLRRAGLAAMAVAMSNHPLTWILLTVLIVASVVAVISFSLCVQRPAITPAYVVIRTPTPVLIRCRHVYYDDGGRPWCWPAVTK